MSNPIEKLQEPSPALALPQTSTIDWLLRSAAGNLSVASMLGDLCNRVVSENVPIAGALLTITSLDPMVARRQMRWRRSDGRVAEEIRFHGTDHSC